MKAVATRRTMLATATAYLGLRPAHAAPVPDLRLGILQFGTVQWVADVIRRHALDTKHGFALAPVTLANTDAGRISLMAGGSDVVVSDWPFVAVQRTAGTKLCFAPFSSSSGGVITAAQPRGSTSPRPPRWSTARHPCWAPNCGRANSTPC